MDSTPPARTRSSHPEATFCAATLTASRPDAQKRLSCTPATVSGSPALIAAVLAMSAPWSPTGVTQPRTTSSTRLGSSRSWRPSISCMRPTTRSTGLVPCSEPLLLPLPRGVRIASKTSASLPAMRRSPCVRGDRGSARRDATRRLVGILPNRSTMRIRSARSGEASAITALVLRSKAHWGYDEAFMAAAAAELTVTEEDLSRADVLVAEREDGTLAGVAAVDGTVLELLFVDPDAMGRGLGGRLL